MCRRRQLSPRSAAAFALVIRDAEEDNEERIAWKELVPKTPTIMADLTRISISLDSALLTAFDSSIAARGYATRSEAMRDLIRDHLIREESKGEAGGVSEQVAVVTLVYDHHARELATRLIDKQHHHHNLVVSTLHVHLGARHCLEVSVLRGPAAEVRHLGEELLSIRGVLHGEITYTSGEGAFNRWH